MTGQTEDLFSSANLERARAAREARDEGIERVTNAAERRAPGWVERASEYVRRVAEYQQHLTAEDVRVFAEAEGFETPPDVDKRAWGGVMQRARATGLIKADGSTTALDPKVHCNRVTRWRSLVFKG